MVLAKGPFAVQRRLRRAATGPHDGIWEGAGAGRAPELTGVGVVVSMGPSRGGVVR